MVKRSRAAREKIKTRRLSVTNAAMVGSFLRGRPEENVEELVEKVEGKSKRECEQLLNGLRGMGPKPKKTVVKEDDQSARVSLTLPAKTWEKLKRLKNLHAHKGWDLVALIDHMAEAELAAVEKKKTVVKTKKNKQFTSPEKSTQEKSKQTTPLRNSTNPTPKIHGRYIKKSIRAQVWDEAGGKCQHCRSDRALEFDHCMPYSWGGSTDVTNLRLLCRECNRRQAVKAGLGYYAGKVFPQKPSPIRERTKSS